MSLFWQYASIVEDLGPEAAERWVADLPEAARASLTAEREAMKAIGGALQQALDGYTAVARVVIPKLVHIAESYTAAQNAAWARIVESYTAGLEAGEG